MTYSKVLAASIFFALSSMAFAQNPGTETSAASDVAKTGANGSSTANTTSGSPSGSGTSTSGGRDANGNQGRDAMPESSLSVRPLDKQGFKPDTPEKSAQTKPKS